MAVIIIIIIIARQVMCHNVNRIRAITSRGEWCSMAVHQEQDNSVRKIQSGDEDHSYFILVNIVNTGVMFQ